MKVRAPSRESRYFEVKDLIHGASLHTICEEARCPNIAECWGRYVHSGKPDAPPDPLEPLRLAQTAKRMRLKHVVVTSVDRDDLEDQGSGHYAATIRALKAKVPEATVEVLTPDFPELVQPRRRPVRAALVRTSHVGEANIAADALGQERRQLHARSCRRRR